MFACLGPKESDFVLNWTPRVLRPGVQLKMNIKFHTGQRFAALIRIVVHWGDPGRRLFWTWPAAAIIVEAGAVAAARTAACRRRRV